MLGACHGVCLPIVVMIAQDIFLLERGQTQAHRQMNSHRCKLIAASVGNYYYTQHTHNRFTALLEYVRDHPGEQVPER